MPKDKFDSIVNKDVVVIGGGTAGFPAAVAAARNGADTLLLERYHYLGGMMTGGLVLGFHTMRIHQDAHGENSYQADRYQLEQVVRGLAMEILERLYDMGGVYGLYGKPGEASSRPAFDPHLMKCLADQMIQEAGAGLWLDSWVAEPVVKGRKLTGLIVYNKSGKHLVQARAFVDCSGDADIASRAGCEYQYGGEEHGRPMATSLEYIMGGVEIEKTFAYLETHPEDMGRGRLEEWKRLYAQGSPIVISGLRGLLQKASAAGDVPLPMRSQKIAPYIGTIKLMVRQGRVVPSETIHTHNMGFDINLTKTEDVTEANVFMRGYILKQVNVLRKYLPGFENAYIIEIAPQLGARESRRVVGGYVLTKDDVVSGRMFDDAIARGGRALNVHAEYGGDYGHWVESKEGKAYGIPYRCLVPRDVDNLLVAGRIISVDHMALGSVRGIPLCIATGQAAGAAAALAARAGVQVRDVDVPQLRQTLLSQGADLGSKAPIFS